MKKIIAFLMFLLFLTGCAPRPVKLVYQLEEVTKLVEDKESFVLVMGASTCPGCLTYKPTLEEIMKKRDTVKIAYLDIDLADQDELRTLVEEVLQFDLVFTPTTLFLKKGEVTDFFIGELMYQDLLQELIAEGYINE